MESEKVKRTIDKIGISKFFNKWRDNIGKQTKAINEKRRRKREEIHFPEFNQTGVTTKIPIHEFMVDLLGGLVPGALFMIGASIAFFPTFFTVFTISQTVSPVDGIFSLNQMAGAGTNSLFGTISKLLTAVKNTPNMLWIGIFSFTIAIAYVLGHLFYRNGPKAPDRKSFLKHEKRILAKEGLKPGDPDYKDKKLRLLKENLACSTENDCEFPYPYLRDYLGHRGLCHLCPFVVWKDKEDFRNRSKTYINLLKIRLKYYFPEKCSIIIRNEAHVRLASSSWYVAKALITCSIYSIIIALISIIIGNVVRAGSISNIFLKFDFYYSVYLIYPVLILIGGGYIISRVEQFIHYQRIREVIYVLETAFTAFAKTPMVLRSPFKEFDYNFSRKQCAHQDCAYHPSKSEATIPYKFEIYKDINNQFCIRFMDSSGESMFSGASYKQKDSAAQAIESIKKNAPDAVVDDQA